MGRIPPHRYDSSSQGSFEHIPHFTNKVPNTGRINSFSGKNQNFTNIGYSQDCMKFANYDKIQSMQMDEGRNSFPAPNVKKDRRASKISNYEPTFERIRRKAYYSSSPCDRTPRFNTKFKRFLQLKRQSKGLFDHLF